MTKNTCMLLYSQNRFYIFGSHCFTMVCCGKTSCLICFIICVLSTTMSHHGHGSCLRSKASIYKLLIQLDTSYKGWCIVYRMLTERTRCIMILLLIKFWCSTIQVVQCVYYSQVMKPISYIIVSSRRSISLNKCLRNYYVGQTIFSE